MSAIVLLRRKAPPRTFEVSFSVQDWYRIDIKAPSEEHAIAKAQALYERHGEDERWGFRFDLMRGGTGDWEAEELPADGANESCDHA